MVKSGFERKAANSLRAGIAVLDGDGVIRWTNPAWTRAAPELADTDSFSSAAQAAIRAVVAGSASYVELHTEAAGRPATLAITPARGGRGAVILYTESSAIRAIAPITVDATRIAEHLTPRELEVLTRMSGGLSNRAIAAELGIEYTTVRGHVQSLLAKLGARSRVDAVASAYRSGLVRETDLALARKSRSGPRGQAADGTGGVREAKVV